MTGSRPWPCYWAQMESGIWASGASWEEVTHEPPRVTEKKKDWGRKKKNTRKDWIYDAVSATGYCSGRSFQFRNVQGAFLENVPVWRPLAPVTLNRRIHPSKSPLRAVWKGEAKLRKRLVQPSLSIHVDQSHFFSFYSVDATVHNFLFVVLTSPD